MNREHAGSDPGRAQDRPDESACEGPAPGASALLPDDHPPGDRFDEMIRPILAHLLRVAKRILRSEALAWDAVQEALLSLWLQPRFPRNPRAWLVRAVIHRSLHLERTNSRRRKHEGRASRGRTEASDRDEPTQFTESQELHAILIEVFSTLREEYRRPFLLRVVEEMDYESISRTLGIPIGTVRSRLSRAREAIRQAIDQELEGNDSK